MTRTGSDLEMHAVFDPRIATLNDLRDGQRARREAQWATWQMDRSWPEGAALRLAIEPPSDTEAQRNSLPWILGAAGFLALGVVGAGLITVGIESGLL